MRFFLRLHPPLIGAASLALILALATASYPLAASAQSNNANNLGNTGFNSGNGTAAAGIGSCTVQILANLIGSSAAAATGQGLAVSGPTIQSGIPVHDTGAATGIAGNGLSNAVTAISNNLNLGINLSNVIRDDVLNCVARSIARAIIQQVAQSTINWINSGFNGSPFYLTNPTQFFSNVADQTAGQFLAGSDLAFLCKPFSLQVKVAIARSYAGANNNQCSITQVTNNVQGFMNNFQNGGWPAFISMTSNPNNQAFGAYLTGLDGLNTALANSQQHYQSQLALSGGFLDFQQKTNCTTLPDTDPRVNQFQASPNKSVTQSAPDASGHTTWTSCNLISATPGTVIANSLSKTVGLNYDELNTAKYFDEIISALVTQLMTKAIGAGGGGGLYGLGSNYGNTSGSYNGGVNSILVLQQDILANIPTYTSNAQQLVALDQQNLSLLSQMSTACGSSTLYISTNTGKSQQQLSGAQASITKLQNLDAQVRGTTDANTLYGVETQFASDVASGVYVQQSDTANALEINQLFTTQLSSVQNDPTQCSALH